jgi:hypothetical protein
VAPSTFETRCINSPILTSNALSSVADFGLNDETFACAAATSGGRFDHQIIAGF